MQDFVAGYFDTHDVELWALGCAAHRDRIDSAPFGRQARYFDAESNPALVRAYLAANRQAFAGALTLPGWVLTDLYLLPGIVGLLVGRGDALPTRGHAEMLPEGKRLLAAYYAAPSLSPGLFIGVSLLSVASGIGAGSMIKVLTLKMNRATRLRGVCRWSARAIRAHARVGPLQLLSRTPGPHENEQSSFVYETSVSEEGSLCESLRGERTYAISERVALEDPVALDAALQRATEGQRLAIVSPGVDEDMRVCLGPIP